MSNVIEKWAGRYVQREIEILRKAVMRHPDKYVDIAVRAGIHPVSLSSFINDHSELTRPNVIAVALAIGKSYEGFHSEVAEQTEKPHDWTIDLLHCPTE